MKRPGTISILIILVILLGSLLVSCEEQPVVFSDKHIEVTIRLAMGKPEGAIYTLDLEKLTYLDVAGANITSLSGLEHCTSLIWLNLVANQISDISPLSSLTNLIHLDLSVNRISDVSPLSSLTSLTNLSLSRNQISDISPLSSLTSLTNLSLPVNQISDVSPLSSLTSLTEHNLVANQISDVSSLSSLTNLTHLDLSRNQISGVSPLSSLTSLTHLDLRQNQISDVSSLSSLINLTELWLSDNPIILPLPPLLGEEEELPPIGPPPPGGYPKLDSALNQLVSAEIRGEAASFAEPRGIELIGGNCVEVIIEVMPNEMEAAIEAATKAGANIGLSYKNLLQAVVPIRNLPALAAEESILLVWMPLTPASADGGHALHPAPHEQVNLPDLVIESVSAEYVPPHGPVMTPGTSYIFTLRIKNIGNAALSDSFICISNTRGCRGLSTIEYSHTQRVNDSKQTIAPGGSLEVIVTDIVESRETRVRFMVNPWAGSFRIEESNYDNNFVEFQLLSGDLRQVTNVTPVSVVFPDKYLKLAIRNLVYFHEGLIDITDSERLEVIIYTTDLERLEGISAAPGNITDLSGLEYCTNLTSLFLVANQISDLSPLSSLTSLTRLQLIRSQISDISPLSSLTNLTRLDLENNQISDISPLSSLTNLTYLDLENNQISDISPLLSLTKLDYLNLRGNNLDFSFGSEDLEHIRQLERQGVRVSYKR